MFTLKKFSQCITNGSKSHRRSLLWCSCLLLSCAQFFAGCVSASGSKQCFRDARQADFIVLYSQDSTSYIYKPLRREGGFFSIFDRSQVLAEAASPQISRGCAVVVLDSISSPRFRQQVMDGWCRDFKQLAFQRVVFLGGIHGDRIEGRPVLLEVDLKGAVSPVADENNTKQPSLTGI